jgi:cytochrome c oxidase assembly protein subunit 15
VTISPTTYRRITLVTLASLVFIMVTGAAVRLTGSGLGCSTWPNCEPDSFVPRDASGGAGLVEFGNRLVTGVVGLFTAAAVIGARKRRPYRRDLFRWSLGLPAWVFANALVGAAVVWLHLTPKSVMVHFLLSLGAVWNALVLHRRAGEDVGSVGPIASVAADAADPADPGSSVGVVAGRRPLAVPRLRRLCDLLVVVAGAVVVTGTVVTGSGPHAGDEAANRLGFELESVVRVHGVVVLAFLALTLLVLHRARRGDAGPPVVKRLEWLVAVVVAQGTVGYAQYFSGVPALLVGLHVLGAALVWIAVLDVRLALSAPGGGDRGASRATMEGDADRRLTAA